VSGASGSRRISDIHPSRESTLFHSRINRCGCAFISGARRYVLRP
jgi:hypothetical protein